MTAFLTSTQVPLHRPTLAQPNITRPPFLPLTPLVPYRFNFHSSNPSYFRRRPSTTSVRTTITAAADFYETLGVSRSADADELKRSFRRLARKWHPDVNKDPGAKEKFQEITRAYEVLSDPNMRARYDQFGEAGVSSAAAASGGGFGGFGDATDFGAFSDIFETFFNGGGVGSGVGGGMGGRRRRTGPQQGDDLRLEVDVEFEKAVKGGTEKIRFTHLERCETCRGDGVKPGTRPKSCTACGGSGTVTQVARTPLGTFQQTSTCPSCKGQGEVVEEYCRSCGGRGRTQVTKQLVITVPAGVDTGSRLRVKNEGDAGIKGGPPGDLYVILKVRADPNFRREGLNIYSSVKISYLDAILGRRINVRTVDGSVELDVVPGTQPGAVLKIEKRGMPKLGNSYVRGDQFVTVNVQIPKRLSTEERELISQLDELSEGSPRSSSSGNGTHTAASQNGKAKRSRAGEGFFNFGKRNK